MVVFKGDRHFQYRQRDFHLNTKYVVDRKKFPTCCQGNGRGEGFDWSLLTLRLFDPASDHVRNTEIVVGHRIYAAVAKPWDAAEPERQM